MKFNRKILLAEDDPEQLLFFSMLLEKAGFKIVTATNAAEALELLKTEKVDCIVSDVQMPGMSAVEFLQKLKQDFADIPKVMMTAASGVAPFELIELGADNFCHKDRAPEILVQQVEKALS